MRQRWSRTVIRHSLGTILCCMESAYEIARWTQCRCEQFGSPGEDCVREAVIAHNDALDNCVDQGENCPVHEYWFLKP